MGFKIGLKLWSVNADAYLSEAERLYADGVFSYIELFVVPGTENTLDAWRRLHDEKGVPFIIHNAHAAQGFNLADESAERKNVEIETDIADGVNVCADTELLSLVWNNLFSNAFKFTEDGGKVMLTLTADEEYATVKIADTGCGMSAEVGAHIFEKFYQGDTSHATQGNGLGLALVKRVVDIMQGEIGVESAVGVGTTFTVKIRRADDGPEEAR